MGRATNDSDGGRATRLSHQTNDRVARRGSRVRGDRSGESKRHDILSATKELLWERGYEATSPRDIMKRSGAGQGSLYHHFPTKLDLACAALSEMASEEIMCMDGIFDTRRPPLERIRRYLRRERDALRGCRLARLANETAVEMPAFRAPISAFLDEIQRRVRDCLAEAKAANEVAAEIDPAVVATALVALIEGGFILARTHWNPSSMELAIDGGILLLSRIVSDPEVVRSKRVVPSKNRRPKQRRA